MPRAASASPPQVGVGLRIFTWQLADDDGIPPRGVVINPYLASAKPIVGEPDPHEEMEGACRCRASPSRSGAASRPLAGLALDGAEICATRPPAGSPGCCSTSTTTSTGSSTSTGSTGKWSRKARKAVKGHGWGVPGLAWMPGGDRDPFGHDDETTRTSSATDVDGPPSASGRRRSHRHRQVRPRDRARAAAARGGRQRRRLAALPRDGHRHGQGARSRSATASRTTSSTSST